MSPCADCPHRKVTCHDHCPEYTEWHDTLVLAKESLKGANKAVALLADNHIGRRDTWRKRMNRLK